jgi:hypothetical protein
VSRVETAKLDAAIADIKLLALHALARGQSTCWRRGRDVSFIHRNCISSIGLPQVCDPGYSSSCAATVQMRFKGSSAFKSSSSWSNWAKSCSRRSFWVQSRARKKLAANSF